MPRFLVTGCSAGGAGALINYYFLRSGLPQAEKGYLLDDSGPIFPTAASRPLHEQIRESWHIDSILERAAGGFDPDDFGCSTPRWPMTFPDDRLRRRSSSATINFSLLLVRALLRPAAAEGRR